MDMYVLTTLPYEGMSHTTVLVHAFVAQLMELLEYIEQRFPEDRDIFYTKTQVEAAAAMSPRLVVVHFMNEVRPYIGELESRNADFFLHLVKSDYDHVLGHMDLAQKWSSLKESEKTYLWDKTQQITHLGQQIV